MKRIKFITLDQLLEMKANDEKFTLVEVLAPDNFQEGHLSGAINIPADKIEQEAATRLDEKDVIIVYCGSYACGASTIAARTLLDMGYKNTLDFKGGKKTWKDAGLALVTGQ